MAKKKQLKSYMLCNFLYFKLKYRRKNLHPYQKLENSNLVYLLFLLLNIHYFYPGDVSFGRSLCKITMLMFNEYVKKKGMEM